MSYSWLGKIPYSIGYYQICRTYLFSSTGGTKPAMRTMNNTTQFGVGKEKKRSPIWEPAYARSNHLACQPQVDDGQGDPALAGRDENKRSAYE